MVSVSEFEFEFEFNVVYQHKVSGRTFSIIYDILLFQLTNLCTGMKETKKGLLYLAAGRTEWTLVQVPPARTTMKCSNQWETFKFIKKKGDFWGEKKRKRKKKDPECFAYDLKGK